MAKTSSRTTKRPAEKLDAAEKLKIDLTRFKPDLTANDLKNALTPVTEFEYIAGTAILGIAKVIAALTVVLFARRPFSKNAARKLHSTRWLNTAVSER